MIHRKNIFSVLQPALLCLLSASLLIGCGQQQNTTTSDSDKETTSSADDNDKSATSDEDIADIDDTSSKKTKKAPKVTYTVEPKPTGQVVDGFEVHQQNEFLGPCVLKISKNGVRLESSTITVILPTGKDAIAYNPQNGNSMELSSKSASMLAGNTHGGEDSKDETKKVGTDKIAGVKCTHYQLVRKFLNKKTKQEIDHYTTDIWATKDLKVPPQVLKDCARMTMMPPELGFPVKVIRETNVTTKIKGKQQGGSRTREVISTSEFKPTKVDTGNFALLSGFKTVKDEMKLMMSDDESELGGSSSLDELDKEKDTDKLDEK